MQHTYNIAAVNTPAKAKILFNKKLNTVKVVIAFNVHKKVNSKGELVHAFPVQTKCAYVSGDIAFAEVNNVIAKASAQLNTNNIEVVVK